MLVVFDNGKDFLQGLLKFFVANTAAHIKSYGDFSLITSQFTAQVQAVWLSAVAAGCRFCLVLATVPKTCLRYKFQGSSLLWAARASSILRI